MQKCFLLVCLLFFCPILFFAQVREKSIVPKPKSIRITDSLKNKNVAPIELYRIITLDRDTTYIDTSLTIRKEYSHNYLRKDNFGLLAFPNEGQTYNTLNYGLVKNDIFPEMGFKAKHFNFM